MRMLLILCAAAAWGGDVDKLAFMAGCWEGSGTLEMWTKPAAGSMLGLSRTVRNGKLASSEFMSISDSAEGLVFEARPRLAASSTKFPAKEVTGTSVTFENATHDFPQRIIYRLVKPGELVGRIEGAKGGKTMAFDFPYKRASCE
jgi:hypothetical protein